MNSLTNYEKISQATDEDKTMMRMKYASPQIGTLTEDKRLIWSKALLLKIHVITGWTIPESELLTILIDQFSKKLTENYGHLNVDEIEFAFRRSGTIIQDWGKAMNLSLIDEVLIPYSNERFVLSAQEERQKSKPPEQKKYTQEEIDNEYRGDIEAFFQRCRNGIVPHAIPKYFEEILIKDGLLNQDEKLSDFFTRKLGIGQQNLYIRNEDNG